MKPTEHDNRPAAVKPTDKDQTDTEQRRTITGRPVDPNRLGADLEIPPGVTTDDALDPGNMTPDAPPTDDRS